MFFKSQSGGEWKSMTHRFLKWKKEDLSGDSTGFQKAVSFSGRRGRTFVGAERILKKAR
jgi:hypothetical protein